MQFKKLITYKINEWTNIPWSAEHGCPWTAASPFGGLDSAHASLQTAPLDSVHVQETQPVRKK
jgi:hypothetical protein